MSNKELVEALETFKSDLNSLINTTLTGMIYLLKTEGVKKDDAGEATKVE